MLYRLFRNLYFQLFKRILVVFLLFTLCRLVFYLYNYDLYRERTFAQLVTIFLGGMRFDISAIVYTNLLYLTMFLLPFRFRYSRIYQMTGKYVYFITNGLILLMNFMDTVYFRTTFRRTTLSVFDEFQNNEKLSAMFTAAFVQNWYLAFFFIGVVILMIWGYGKHLDKSSIRIQNQRIYYTVGALSMLPCYAAIIIGVRGGLQDGRPLSMNYTGAYATAAIDVPLVLNTPFAVYTNVGRKPITRMIYYREQSELNSIYTPVHIPVNSETGFKDMNVMIIIIESFGRERFGFYNRDLDNGTFKGYTPFLDTLISKHCFTPVYSYANGRKSIDAPVSVLMSIPSIPEPFVVSGYYNNMTRSLPLLLREKGYETAFFCGHPNGALGYAGLCKIIGINRYFGMNEYGNDADYDGCWGIWDDLFFEYTIKEIGQLRQPFFTTLFTVTSHYPYPIPKHREADFAGYDDLYKRGIRYTDDALRQFFKSAASQPWFSNTLFVLVADHIHNVIRDEYKTSSELFAVPVVFYKPDDSIKKIEYRVAQQIDIMPTVLGYLGYDEPYLAFGFDLNKTKDNFAFNYFNGTYQLITDKYLLLFDGQKSTGLYELRIDRFLSKNLIDTHKEVVESLEAKAKAFLQQYTSRMLDNRLVE